MPKADATGLAPEKSAEQNPSVTLSLVTEGFLFVRPARPFLWWSLGAEALGIQRDDRPKGAPYCPPFGLRSITQMIASNLRKSAGNSVTISWAKIVIRYTLPLPYSL